MGSLSYDFVWEKSDVDMVVIIRDQKITSADYCLDEENVVINASIATRSDFIRRIEKSGGGTIVHSLYSKGEMIYTTDESLREIFEESKAMGASDVELAAMLHACEIVGGAEKVEKWLRVKEDVSYANFYILKTSESIARMEVTLNGIVPTREAVIQASAINPGLMERFYGRPIRKPYDVKEAFTALEDIYKYVENHMDVIKRPVLEYLEDGQIKTLTMLKNHFRTDAHFISHLMEYMAGLGVIHKCTQTIRITPKGRQTAEEIAYYINV